MSMDRNRRAIRERILNSRKQAERAAAELHAAEHISKDILHECLMDYVLSKFSLSRDQCNTESFNEITELSIEKSLEISKELLQDFEAAKSCDGVTTAIAKKTLLFLAIERDFEVELSAIATARIVNMGDFTEVVWSAMKNAPAWREKLREAPEEDTAADTHKK